jgi:hypothetical protein
MKQEPIDEFVGRLRDAYHVPPETPREEIWAGIEARLADGSRDVIAIERGLRLRAVSTRKIMGWAAAAAAVLVLGVGIGRMTAPVPVTTPLPQETASAADADTDLLRLAALEHLGRTEFLLTLVRADARSGRVDPEVGAWAASLLSQTRLLLDRPGAVDPPMQRLLEDLEFVLMQIVGVSDAEGSDEARARSELTLTLEGMEEREVLHRIQAVIPVGTGVAGT